MFYRTPESGARKIWHQIVWQTLQKPTPVFWRQFLAPVSGACVISISIDQPAEQKCSNALTYYQPGEIYSYPVSCGIMKTSSSESTTEINYLHAGNTQAEYRLKGRATKTEQLHPTPLPPAIRPLALRCWRSKTRNIGIAAFAWKGLMLGFQHYIYIIYVMQVWSVGCAADAVTARSRTWLAAHIGKKELKKQNWIQFPATAYDN